MARAIPIGWPHLIGKYRSIFLRYSHLSLTGRFGIMESTLGFQSHCYCNFFSDVANVRASKIPQDRLELLLSILAVKRGSDEVDLELKRPEDFVDDSPVEFKLTLIIKPQTEASIIWKLSTDGLRIVM